MFSVAPSSSRKSEGHQYQNLEPRTELVSPNKTGKAKSCEGWAYCARTPSKDLFLLYFEKTCPQASVTGARPDARYSGRWWDPREGKWTDKKEQLTASADGKMTLPPFPGGSRTSKTDWALKLRRVK